jgi:catechol 2,3-dioxygenase-like lactoylglutathione lyase family enzyme
MSDPDFAILYVADVAASAAFYERVLGRKPLEASPGFAMFGLSNGLKLGLWKRSPAAAHGNHAGEFGFVRATRAAVDAQAAAWAAQGFEIAQAPQALDFGSACLARDPDGFGLRAFMPNPD